MAGPGLTPERLAEIAEMFAGSADLLEQPDPRGTAGPTGGLTFRAPPGSYDPALDAAERASGRGLADLLLDLDRARDRDFADYGLGREDILRARNQSLADLLQAADYYFADQDVGYDRTKHDYEESRGRLDEDYDTRRGDLTEDYGTAKQRTVEDYGTARTRTREDYQRTIQGLVRQYERLGGQQTQQARAQGVAQGGTLAQALRKRQENKAYDQFDIDRGYQRRNQDLKRSFTRTRADQDTGYERSTDALDTSYERSRDDMGTNWDRYQEDLNRGDSRYRTQYATNVQRTGQQADLGLGRLALGLQRNIEDRGVRGTRAQREHEFFKQDTQEARIGQVRQTMPDWLREWEEQQRQAGR